MATTPSAVSGGNATLHPENFGLGAFLSTPDRIVIPRRARGRLSPAAEHAYQQQLVSFAAAIKAISQRLDFKVSSRGWCYLLEPHGLVKGDFDLGQELINHCRKTGLLPLDICADDSARTFFGVEYLDDEPEKEVEWRWNSITQWLESYTPVSFWDFQSCYVQMVVEKIDLRSLFEPVCAEYLVPIANARGWSDLNLRGGMMTRFKEHEEAGRRPVLLYCGDHDPAGLRISDSLRSNMEELSVAVGWRPDNLIIDRFGLNADFIEANGLTWIDNLLTGSGKDLASPKHPDHHQPYVKTYLERFGARKVEANALVVAATAGRELCRSALLKYIETDPILERRSRLDLARVELRQHFVQSVTAQATAWEARP